MMLAAEIHQQCVTAELEQVAAVAITWSRAEKKRLTMAVISSAPALPNCDSFSDMAVKPETSEKSTVPSTKAPSTRPNAGLASSGSTTCRGR
jgi:hypothetical protein